MNAGRRKLLVEMATGTGKTRTATALIKRLFEASAVTRVLFLVDRITLAKQTEDVFNEHLPDYPCYVLRAGRRFQDEKRITITTLQSMINVYRDYSAGYFDLIITDECHRSLRKPLIGKTIVFAVTKRHAETLAQMFDKAFAHEKPSPDVRYADFVVSGCGRDDTVDGPTRIKRFKKEAFPRILVSVNMLDTGFDAPEVVNLVMARFTRSVILYRQMRGRGTRKAPCKALFTMFDFVGVTDYHDDDETIPEGGFIKETKPRTRHEPRTLLTLDIDDHIDPTTREWVTIDENGNFVFLAPDEQRATLLGARFEAWIGTQTGLHSDSKRLLLTIGEYIKANADILERFTLDHFVVPPFSNIGGLQRAIQTFGSEERLQRTLASLNHAVFSEEGVSATLEQNIKPNGSIYSPCP